MQLISLTMQTGLRVAQVRVLFKLPAVYGIKSNQPLAYIEWFTPLGAQLEVASDMYTVTRSTRMHRVYAEIIEVDRIARNCHLVPKYGRVKPRSWSSTNVADLCSSFFVNDKKDPHMFCMLKLGKYGCI